MLELIGVIIVIAGGIIVYLVGGRPVQEVRREARTFLGLQDPGEAGQGAMTLDKDILNYLKSKPYSVQTSQLINEKKLTSYQIALTVMASICHDMLGSGYLHQEQGQLSAGGRYIRAVAEAAYKELVKGKAVKKQTSLKELVNLDKLIANTSPREDK